MNDLSLNFLPNAKPADTKNSTASYWRNQNQKTQFSDLFDATKNNPPRKSGNKSAAKETPPEPSVNLGYLATPAYAAMNTPATEAPEDVSVLSDMDVTGSPALPNVGFSRLFDLLSTLGLTEGVGNLNDMEGQMALDPNLFAPVSSSELSEVLSTLEEALLLDGMETPITTQETLATQDAPTAAQTLPIAAPSTPDVSGIAPDARLQALLQQLDAVIEREDTPAPALLAIQSAVDRLARQVAGQPLNNEATAVIPEEAILTAPIAAPETWVAGSGEEQDAFLQDNSADTSDNSSFLSHLAGTQRAPVAAPADVVAPPTPVMPTRFVDEIVDSVKLQQSQGISQLRIVLSPEGLGRVSVLLETSAEGLRARIQSDNPTVRGIMAAQITELEGKLKELGIHMKSIDVTNPESGYDSTRSGGQTPFSSNHPGQRAFEEGPRSGPSTPTTRPDRSPLPQVPTTTVTATSYEMRELHTWPGLNEGVDFLA